MPQPGRIPLRRQGLHRRAIKFRSLLIGPSVNCGCPGLVDVRTALYAWHYFTSAGCQLPGSCGYRGEHTVVRLDGGAVIFNFDL